MRIRPATPGDEAVILRLTEQLSAFPIPPWRTPREIAGADHAILRSALRQPAPDTSLLVAEGALGLLGCVFTTTREDYFTHEAHAHVEVLAVEPAARRQGVGQALMAAAEAWARDRGYRRVTLNVFAQNERARLFYDRLGYQPETVHYLREL